MTAKIPPFYGGNLIGYPSLFETGQGVRRSHSQDAYGSTWENQANVVTRRQYVTLGDWGNFYIRNPTSHGLISGLTDPVTGRTLSSTWVPRNAPNMRDNPEHQKSVLLATQARYFDDRLVLGLGFRADKLDTITRGTTRDANGLIMSDYANHTFASYDGKTRTLGAVYHVTSRPIRAPSGRCSQRGRITTTASSSSSG